MSHLLTVIEEVIAECARQQVLHGQDNETNQDGTGPGVIWVPLAAAGTSATRTEIVFRRDYEAVPKPTWMHLVREELAEAFMEDPEGEELDTELTQTAALIVSWLTQRRRRKA